MDSTISNNEENRYDTKSFREIVRKFREDNHITYDDLARKCGLSVSSFRNYLARKEQPKSLIERVIRIIEDYEAGNGFNNPNESDPDSGNGYEEHSEDEAGISYERPRRKRRTREQIRLDAEKEREDYIRKLEDGYTEDEEEQSGELTAKDKEMIAEGIREASEELARNRVYSMMDNNSAVADIAGVQINITLPSYLVEMYADIAVKSAIVGINDVNIAQLIMYAISVGAETLRTYSKMDNEDTIKALDQVIRNMYNSDDYKENASKREQELKQADTHTDNTANTLIGACFKIMVPVDIFNVYRREASLQNKHGGSSAKVTAQKLIAKAVQDYAERITGITFNRYEDTALEFKRIGREILKRSLVQQQ